MHMLLFIIFSFFLHNYGAACECEHVFDSDVIALIDAEGDTYSDDYLYDDCQTHMMYEKKPEKLLQQAAYAFDNFLPNLSTTFIRWKVCKF